MITPLDIVLPSFHTSHPPLPLSRRPCFTSITTIVAVLSSNTLPLFVSKVMSRSHTMASLGVQLGDLHE